jgi:hypothetical protein
MGLDMYAHSVSKNNAIDDLTFVYSDKPQDNIEIFYWRKHHDLHGWMQKLFNKKGGSGDFNLQPVRLTLEDLDQLEEDLKSNILPETDGFFFETDGFFFGNNPPDDESNRRDFEFIRMARSHINVGREIYYNSWW